MDKLSIKMRRRELMVGASGLVAATLLPKVNNAYANVVLPDDSLRSMDPAIVSPDTKGAKFLSRGFNAKYAGIPRRRIICRSPKTVVAALKELKASGESFALRSTGHCFAGYSNHSENVLDLSGLDWVTPKGSDGTVNIGAGAWIGNAYRALGDVGRGLPGGTYTSVGATGNLLGGGLGFLSRPYGLLCDHVVSIDMVSADGQLVCASHNENADLFWALRGGGGGSFGVVLGATFNTVPLKRCCSIKLTLTVPAAEAERIVYDWQDWTLNDGERTTTHLKFSRYSDNSIIIDLTGISLDGRDETITRVQSLIGLRHGIYPHHVVESGPQQMYDRLYSWHHWLTPVHVELASEFIEKPMTLLGVSQLIDTLMQHGPNAVKLTFEALGGAVSKVTNTDTTYPHRNASFLCYLISEVSRPGTKLPRQNAMNAVRSELSKSASGGIYVNYPERGLKNWQRRYWRNNVERLVEAKLKWDPSNFFKHAQSVPLRM